MKKIYKNIVLMVSRNWTIKKFTYKEKVKSRAHIFVLTTFPGLDIFQNINNMICTKYWLRTFCGEQSEIFIIWMLGPNHSKERVLIFEDITDKSLKSHYIETKQGFMDKCFNSNIIRKRSKKQNNTFKVRVTSQILSRLEYIFSHLRWVFMFLFLSQNYNWRHGQTT